MKGDKIDSIRIVCEDKHGLDWFSGGYIGEDKTTITHGFRKDGPTWGMKAAVVGSYDHNGNKKYYGVNFMIDY